MFKIDTSTIHCSRGDTGTITLKIPYIDNNGYFKYLDGEDNVYWYDKSKKKLYDAYYEFEVGDKVKFNIYEAKGYDSEPLVSKTIEVSSASYEVDISLYEADTTFGEISNKPITYWYDITLNNDLTVVGYNEDGAKLFIQYPAKGEDE